MVDWRSTYLEVEGLLRFALWPETALAWMLAPFVLLGLPFLVLLAMTANRPVPPSGASRGSWELEWRQRI